MWGETRVFPPVRAFLLNNSCCEVIVLLAWAKCLLQLSQENSLWACLDPMNSKQYLKSVSHFIIGLFSDFSQFLGTKPSLGEIRFVSES